MTILVTGGAGFVGANFILDWFERTDEPLVNVDLLTYAGNLETLSGVADIEGYTFVKGDIADRAVLTTLLAAHRPRAIVNFAVESRVDRALDNPAVFLQTNIVGTYELLETLRAYWQELDGRARDDFRVLHISTDEVYGSLDADAPAFREVSPYAPNSPYAASKAAADHLVRAWHHTYGLPTLTTHCSSNYGPYQFLEKMIPMAIINAISGKPIVIHGDGQHQRDWLYIEDHCDALRCVLEQGVPGETYNIGGTSELRNLEVIERICGLLDTLRPRPHSGSYTQQIEFLEDRPGHDRRYAIDAQKIATTLGWTPKETFDTGLRRTVQWYLDHPDWIDHVQNGAYRHWLQNH